jgi:hypothetical protein
MPSHDFELSRNAFGRLVFRSPEGEVHEGIVAVRAFPIAAPETGIALVSVDGHELAWIESLADLPEAARGLVEAELAAREFMPQIKRLSGVSGFATPSTWRVETDRGDTEFVLKGEEDIHRLSAQTLLIVDSHGIQFLIRDLPALDAGSRRLLDRFL